MWLASVSKWKTKKRPVPASAFSDTLHAYAEHILDKVLEGVGDRRMERAFRMCLTECRHRSLTDEEIAGLPQAWKDATAHDLAGGPLHIFWSRGIPDEAISANPCENPRREQFPGASDLYLPFDCGACPPCLARIKSHETGEPCGWNRSREASPPAAEVESR